MEENLALRAYKNRNLTEYLKTVTIVQAITYGASAIANVMAGENPGSPDNLNKLLDQVKSLLLPELAGEKDDKAKRVKEIMEQEVKQGPFQVEAMVYKKRGKGLN